MLNQYEIIIFTCVFSALGLLLIGGIIFICQNIYTDFIKESAWYKKRQYRKEYREKTHDKARMNQLILEGLLEYLNLRAYTQHEELVIKKKQKKGGHINGLRWY